MDAFNPTHFTRGSLPTNGSASQNRSRLAFSRDHLDGLIPLNHQARKTQQNLQISLILITVS
jgi:hypothetical protein